MECKIEDGNSDSLVAYLHGESFKHYFDYFRQDSELTEEAKSLQVLIMVQLQK